MATMQVDSDPLQVKETFFAEPVKTQMVKATKGLAWKLSRSLWKTLKKTRIGCSLNRNRKSLTS